MITASLRARLDHARAFRKLMPHAVDLDVEQWRGWVCWAAIIFSNRHRAPARARESDYDHEHEHEVSFLNRSFRAGFFPARIVRHRNVFGISSFSISSSGVYSGGSGGGTGFLARAANSSGNFSTKLCVGHAHASPKAQMVRPAMLSPIVLSVSGSSTTPPPRSMRSVIFLHPERTFAAGCALAAALVRVKLVDVVKNPDHVARIIQHDHAARTRHRTGGSERIEIHRDIIDRHFLLDYRSIGLLSA